MSRTFDLISFGEGETYTVTLGTPLFQYGYEGTHDIIPRIDSIQEWTDLHCEGDYIILVTSVAFKLEKDAFIFKLKYG